MGVEDGGVLAAVEYPDPKSRRVEENRRDGKRLEVEYYDIASEASRAILQEELTSSFQSTTAFSIQGIRLIVTNSRVKRPNCCTSSSQSESAVTSFDVLCLLSD